jgi:hypothetical protein
MPTTHIIKTARLMHVLVASAGLFLIILLVSALSRATLIDHDLRSPLKPPEESILEYGVITMASSVDYLLPPRDRITKSLQLLSGGTDVSDAPDIQAAAARMTNDLCHPDATKTTTEEIENLCATVASIRNSFDGVRRSLKVFDDGGYKDASGTKLELLPQWNALTEVSRLSVKTITLIARLS